MSALREVETIKLWNKDGQYLIVNKTPEDIELWRKKGYEVSPPVRTSAAPIKPQPPQVAASKPKQ